MEKQIALSIYRSYKETFENNDLQKLSRELSSILQTEIDIVSIPSEDGEKLQFILNK